MSIVQTYAHPFKQGVMTILDQHFSTEIASRFRLTFEHETFNKDASPHINRQVKDNMYVMEVYYDTGKTLEYVCDLYSWESKARTEAQLLKMITDKVKSGQFGQDWVDINGRVSKDVASGKYETQDEPVLKGGED